MFVPTYVHCDSGCFYVQQCLVVLIYKVKVYNGSIQNYWTKRNFLQWFSAFNVSGELLQVPHSRDGIFLSTEQPTKH